MKSKRRKTTCAGSNPALTTDITTLIESENKTYKIITNCVYDNIVYFGFRFTLLKI